MNGFVTIQSRSGFDSVKTRSGFITSIKSLSRIVTV